MSERCKSFRGVRGSVLRRLSMKKYIERGGYNGVSGDSVRFRASIMNNFIELLDLCVRIHASP